MYNFNQYFNTEFFTTLQKDNVATIKKVADKFSKEFEKVSKLQHDVIRTYTNKNLELAEKVMNAGQDAKVWAELQKEFFDVTAYNKEATEFGQKVYNLFNTLQADIVKMTQEQIDKVAKNSEKFVDEQINNAPQGTEAIAKMFKTAFDNSNTFFANLQKSAEEMTTTMQKATDKVVETATTQAK